MGTWGGVGEGKLRFENLKSGNILEGTCDGEILVEGHGSLLVYVAFQRSGCFLRCFRRYWSER